MPRTVGSITVLEKPIPSVDSPGAFYHGLNPSTTLLPKGHQKSPAHRPLADDLIFDRDVELKLRDGVKIRADIFRPVTDAKVPALLSWSPYGKSGAGLNALNFVPGRVGVPQHMLSGYEKFESPDPAEWIGRGYALVNVDTRGSFDSEGNLRWFGKAEAEDGHDSIEEIAKMSWCNGRVATVGNSWLAMIQWHIAAERPPHLSCIAPFEGASDFYRETLCRGGVPYNKPFWDFLGNNLFGRNQEEDVIAMIDQHPYMNEYWEDKRAKIENIEVPAYILASYSTFIHTRGSFRGFEDMKHKEKWLRVHPTQEWNDLYKKTTNDDLQKFLDRYTKGIDNGWEKTPPVRLSLLNFTPNPVYDIPFQDWPLPDTRYTKLYLGPSGQLSNARPTDSSVVSYQSDVPAMQIDADTEEVLFTYTFEKKAHLVGYPKAVLYVSGETTDMDVFVQLRKASSDGRILRNINIPLEEMGVSSESEVAVTNPNIYLGPTGVLRASRRAIDESRSSKHWAVHSHTKESEQLLRPGEIVELDIGCWPMGMIFEAGEKLVLKIAGHPMILAEFELLRGQFKTINKGRHSVHFGGEYGSQIVLPIVDI